MIYSVQAFDVFGYTEEFIVSAMSLNEAVAKACAIVESEYAMSVFKLEMNLTNMEAA